MIEREDRDGTAIVRLAHGKASALDLELCDALVDTFGAISREAPRAVVMTGSGRIFCAGVDLHRVAAEGAPYLKRFLPRLSDAFEALFHCPVPVVGACNGHAIAGGAVLLGACDVRIAAAGAARIGVPELQVGVPFPPIALEILRESVSPGALRRMVLTGDTIDVDAAAAIGLVDEVVAETSLLDRALERADTMAAVPHETFAISKRQVQRPATERVAAAANDDAADVTARWLAPDTLDAIRGYVDRVLGGKG